LPSKSARTFSCAITGILLAVSALLPCPAWCTPFSFYALLYSFTDDQAKSVQLPEWCGKPMILTMEYSSCRFM